MPLRSQRGPPRTGTTKEKVLSTWKVKVRVLNLPSAGMPCPALAQPSLRGEFSVPGGGPVQPLSSEHPGQ